MYGFLLTRRWVALAVVVVALGLVCARLGWWQLERLGERRAQSALVEANLDSPVVPAQQVMPVGEAPAADNQWRPVSVRGQFEPDGQVLLRYQVRAGLRGVDVVVPMMLTDGTAVLVDRGFLESPAGTPDASTVPPPPAGPVTVTGWLRQDSTAEPEATAPVDGTVRAVSSQALAGVLPVPLRGGWVQALEETGDAAGADLAGPDPPETGSGPHLFYGLQWFFFGFLALLGYVWFAHDEAHPRAPRPDQRSRAVLTSPG